MAKIMLFGSSNIFGVTSETLRWLNEYNRQGHEFIVGDLKGSDTAFQKALASIGAMDNTTIYCMDYARNNIYGFRERRFLTSYNPDEKIAKITADDKSIEPYIIEGVDREADIAINRSWYEFRDRQMISDCSVAIGLYDGESNKVIQIIRLLNIKNKQCYTFTI